MGDAASLISARVPLSPLRSKRLLSIAGDETLVEQIRRGNEAAFEVAFERHGAGILGFCRHMLGSVEEAEDAVQHTFAAAFRALQRDRDRDVALRPWLYAIARNRCISVLRSRREQASEHSEPVTAGLAEEVERRAELRDLVSDLRELPDDERAALLLSEASGLSHAEIANVLGCGQTAVKALVFRARSRLIQRRAARETPCEEIREQLATLRGGSLRRGALRHHLRECPGCRAYREQIRQQRRMLAAALPVAPSLGLKSSVLAAAGLGGGSAAGGGIAAGLGGAATGSFGGATLAKVALVGVIAGGGAVAGKTAVDDGGRQRERPPAASAAEAPAAEVPAAGTRAAVPLRRHSWKPPVDAEAAHRQHPPSAPPGKVQRGDRKADRPMTPQRSGKTHEAGRRGAVPPGHLAREAAPRGAGGNGVAHGYGHSKPAATPDPAPGGNGRGPIDAPPARTPVKRGPPDARPAAEPPAKVKVMPKAPARAHAAPKPAAPPSAPGAKAPKAPKPGADSAPGD